MTMINLDSFLITLIFSLLIISKYSANAVNEFSGGACIAGYNYTNNHQIEDTFQNNVQALFGMFWSEAASRSYDFYVTGESPDKAYGHYLCRGDTTSDLCSTCVTQLTINNYQTTGCREMITFTDTCMVYYANYSFHGRYNPGKLAGVMLGKGETTRESNRTLEGVVEGLITDVASINNTKVVKRYTTREGRVGGSDEKVYGLAQCTPDINNGNCTDCLKEAFTEMQECCGDTKAAFTWLPNCQLRYDNTSFYALTAPAPTTKSSAVSATFPLVVVSGLFFINLLFC